jgi:hypothetical protein
MTNTYTPKPGSNAAALVQALRARQIAMRTDELASICGIESGSVQATLVAAVNAGVVTCCKVTSHGRQVNEYRIGSGMVPRTHAGEYKPPKATILPVRQGGQNARPQPIYPAAPDQSRQAQPAVANNTGSDPQASPSAPAAVVVAATAATPAPKSKLRELGPASIKVPAATSTVSTPASTAHACSSLAPEKPSSSCSPTRSSRWAIFSTVPNLSGDPEPWHPSIKSSSSAI